MILSGCCISFTKPVITFACLPTTNSTTPNNNKTIAIDALKQNFPTPTPRPTPTSPNRPSLAEVERAIGAGIYRDQLPTSETKDENNNSNVFEVVLSNSIGKTEGPTERKLRETGEWLNAQTEMIARSSGRKILEIMFFWIAPTWLLLLLVATGALKLPFEFKALNDLIM